MQFGEQDEALRSAVQRINCRKTPRSTHEGGHDSCSCQCGARRSGRECCQKTTKAFNGRPSLEDRKQALAVFLGVLLCSEEADLWRSLSTCKQRTIPSYEFGKACKCPS